VQVVLKPSFAVSVDELRKRVGDGDGNGAAVQITSRLPARPPALPAPEAEYTECLSACRTPSRGGLCARRCFDAARRRQRQARAVPLYRLPRCAA
jgi:hypothetical protein